MLLLDSTYSVTYLIQPNCNPHVDKMLSLTILVAATSVARHTGLRISKEPNEIGLLQEFTQ
jgi:hypothetical protein